MPLRAAVDHRDVVAPLCDLQEWEAVRARSKANRDSVRMVCCGWPALPKGSAKVIRHFAHRPGAECQIGEGETVHHLRLKSQLVQALDAHGWHASTEQEIGARRADVLATCGPERVAFEVQWSQQTPEVTEERTRYYAQRGVRCVWLMRRKLPEEVAARPDVPCFQVLQDEDEYRVLLGGQRASVGELVERYLAGTMHPTEPVLKQQQIVEVIACDLPCEHCETGVICAVGFPERGGEAICDLRVGRRHSWSERIYMRAASEVERHLASGQLTLPGVSVRHDAGPDDLPWTSRCGACGVQLEPIKSSRGVRSATRHPERHNVRTVLTHEHRMLERPSFTAEAHWCTPEGCVTFPQRPERTALPGLLAAAAGDADQKPTQVERPSTLAGTSPSVVTLLRPTHWAAITQPGLLHQLEVQVQQARLRERGWNPVWITTDPSGNRLIGDGVTAVFDPELTSKDGRTRLGGIVRRLAAGGPVDAAALQAAPQQRLEVWKWSDGCYRCGRSYERVGTSGTWRSCCGVPIYGECYRDMTIHNDVIGPVVAQLLKAGRIPSSARVQNRWSKTVSHRYWANVCPHCNAMSGKHFDRMAMIDVLVDETPPDHVVVFPTPRDVLRRSTGDPHKCLALPACGQA